MWITDSKKELFSNQEKEEDKKKSDKTFKETAPMQDNDDTYYTHDKRLITKIIVVIGIFALCLVIGCILVYIFKDDISYFFSEHMPYFLVRYVLRYAVWGAVIYCGLKIFKSGNIIKSRHYMFLTVQLAFIAWILGKLTE